MNRPVHFEIQADDPDKVSAFYRDVFGWKIASWGGGEQGYWLATTGEGPGIDGGFLRRHFKEQAVINTIDVPSLSEALKKVVDAGGAVRFGPATIPGIGEHAYCTDPEGNWFGVLEAAT